MTATGQLLSEALGLYALKQPQAELIRHNENMTYKITDTDKKYVLRIHKRVEGFTFDRELFDVAKKAVRDERDNR